MSEENTMPANPEPDADREPRPDRELARRVAVLAAVCTLLVGVAGCGGTASQDVNQAISNAARVAREMTELSHRIMRAWCPQAVAGGGRELTTAQARACLDRAKSAYLRELRNGGYDPRTATGQ
jgi:hypothetical protein